jgi:predicted negative regulator of RcsB-dependent stress response
MKSERRHELETNDLARKIVQAPNYFKTYGGQIALVVVVVVAVALLVNYRIRSKRANLAATQNGVATARDSINRLASMNPMAATPREVAARRQQLISDAIQAIDTVNERSEDPKYLSKAQVLRGDLYWTAANLMELPGAATQPALAVEPKAEDALTQAEAAYKRVLENYPDQMLACATARFGLAAIAENRGTWDEARKQYESLKGDANLPEGYKKLAESRLQLLPTLEKGAYLVTAEPAGATTEPTTQGVSAVAPVPAATGPATRGAR